ncbi:peptidase inhibitor family I36 protein [Streptomyces sp. NPDC006193]|uniref:peptidase inhibitor family I36 protein n=1 Tax=Streptomyces sp. NPDC006193 TaxID=3155717 RepID=UPI00339E57A1
MSLTRPFREAALVAASLAPAASPAAVAAPAPQAAEPCHVEHFCLWGRGRFEGPMAPCTKGSRDVAGQGLTRGGRSAWNRTSEAWCLGYNPGCASGAKEIVKPGGKVRGTPYAFKSLLPRSDWRC